MRRWATTLSAAESYPKSKVRDSGPECQAVMAQEQWPRVLKSYDRTQGSCLPHKVLEWSCRALEDRPGLPRGWRWKMLRKAGPGEGPHAAIAASLALGQSSAQ